MLGIPKLIPKDPKTYPKFFIPAHVACDLST